MIIWKEGMPYVVNQIEDLADIVSDEVFGQLQGFIEKLIDESSQIEKLEDEISSLQYEIDSIEEEKEDLENVIEQLKEKYSYLMDVERNLKDFIDVMDVKRLNKDQEFYYDRLLDFME